MDKYYKLILTLVFLLIIVAILVSNPPYKECSGVLRTPDGKAISGTKVFLNIYPYDTLTTDAFGGFRFKNIPKDAGNWAMLKVYKDGTHVIWKQNIAINTHTMIVVK
jgi:hypothetical protein